MEVAGAAGRRLGFFLSQPGTRLATCPDHKEMTIKIFTIRRMLGIAAIGVAYVHGKRGGDATLASIADTLRYVWSSAAERLGIQDRAQRAMPEQRMASPKMGVANGLERTPRPHGGS